MPFKDQTSSFRNIQGIRYICAEDVPAEVASTLAGVYRGMGVPARCVKIEDGMSRVFVVEQAYLDALKKGLKIPRWDDETSGSIMFE